MFLLESIYQGQRQNCKTMNYLSVTKYNTTLQQFHKAKRECKTETAKATKPKYQCESLNKAELSP